MKKLFIILLVLCSSAYAGDETKKKITLNAKGTAVANAEQAFIEFRIQTENEDSLDAEKDLQKKIIILDKELEIPVISDISAIKTSALVHGPFGIYFKPSASASVTHQQNFYVIIKNYSQLPKPRKYLAELIDKLNELGFVEGLSVYYRMEHPRKLQDQAYAIAVESARERALAMAKNTGKELGSLLIIRDNSLDENYSAGSNNIYSVTSEIRVIADLNLEYELLP